MSELVWKDSGTLADGREIIYFDESPGLGRGSVPDRRPLAPSAAGQDGESPQLRLDPLTGEWVIIAGQRQDRTFLPPARECPLCPSRPGMLTEIPAPGYDVVVFENRFPSLQGQPPATEKAPGKHRANHAAAGVRALRGRVLHRRPRHPHCQAVPPAGTDGA